MCCSRQDTAVRPVVKPKVLNKVNLPASAYDIENPEAGCYFYVKENACHMEWAVSKQNMTNIILFAHPSLRVPQGKFHAVPLLDSTTDSTLLDSLCLFCKEVSPFLPELTMMKDAKGISLRVQLTMHQRGSDIIGNRTVKLKPGEGSVFIQGCDCIGITPASSNYEPKSPLPLLDFIEQHKKHNGRFLQLDPSGYVQSK